jgi:hypothetical protein
MKEPFDTGILCNNCKLEYVQPIDPSENTNEKRLKEVTIMAHDTGTLYRPGVARAWCPSCGISYDIQWIKKKLKLYSDNAMLSE